MGPKGESLPSEPSGRECPSSEAGKDELTDRNTAFDGRVGAFHVGGIDKAEVGVHGGAGQTPHLKEWAC